MLEKREFPFFTQPWDQGCSLVNLNKLCADQNHPKNFQVFRKISSGYFQFLVQKFSNHKLSNKFQTYWEFPFSPQLKNLLFKHIQDRPKPFLKVSSPQVFIPKWCGQRNDGKKNLSKNNMHSPSGRGPIIFCMLKTQF